MEWINVKDRLPINNNEVLISDTKNVWIGSCRWHSVDDHSWSVSGMYAPVKSKDITHWQNLPEPSKL